MKTINSEKSFHPKIWFFCLIGAISIVVGLMALGLNLFVAQKISKELLQSIPTVSESAAHVNLFPIKIFVTAAIFVFVPLLLGWYFRVKFANYILAASVFFLLSTIASMGVLAAYREYMKTEIKEATISGHPVPKNKNSPSTYGQITAVTEVPIAKMTLSGSLLIAVGALFWIRKSKAGKA